MVSVYNLKKRIAAHHKNDKAGPFRINMNGESMRTHGKGAAKILLDKMPDEAIERLAKTVPDVEPVKPTPEAEKIFEHKKKIKKPKKKEQPKKKETEVKEEVVEDKVTGTGVTREELEEKADEMSFSEFRKWARKEHKVTGKSYDGIIDDILAGVEEVE